MPCLLAGSRIAGDQGQRRRRLVESLFQRNRTADDHVKIVRMWPLIGHHELEMHPKELPSEAIVVLRPDNFTEPDRYDGGNALARTGINAVAADRIERE